MRLSSRHADTERCTRSSVGLDTMVSLAEACSKLVGSNGEVITANAVREGGEQAAAFGKLMASRGMVGQRVGVPVGVCPGNVAKEVQVVSWKRA